MERPRLLGAIGLALAVLLGVEWRRTRGHVPRAPSGGCPADDLGALRGGPKLPAPDCGSGPPCAEACLDGDAVACYVRGLELEGKDAKDATTWQLRACRGGLAIGCTNYAATLWSGAKGASPPCATRLFDKACAATDAWACGMFGRVTIDDATPPLTDAAPRAPLDVAARDQIRRGREVLERSCETYGQFPCRVLALELEKGALGDVAPGAIQKLLARACATGDELACGAPAKAADTFNEITP